MEFTALFALVMIGVGTWIIYSLMNDITDEIISFQRKQELVDVALKQRLKLLEYVYQMENAHRFDYLNECLETVTFEEHVDHLASGGDLKELYATAFLPVLNEFTDVRG